MASSQGHPVAWETTLVFTCIAAICAAWWWFGGPGAVLGVCGLAVVCVIYQAAQPAGPPSRSRADRIGSKQAISDAQTKMANRNGVWVGRAGGKDLYCSTEDRGVIIGPPGVGKTSFLVSQIMKWSETKRSLVCLDVKPEIEGLTRSALQRAGYRIIVFNPTAQPGKTARYNPLDDLLDPEAVIEFSTALIPTSTLENSVFFESARSFLDGLITHLRLSKPQISIADVTRHLSRSDSYLQILRDLTESSDDAVREIAAGLVSTASNDRLLGSICANLLTNLKFIRLPRVRDALSTSDFSLHDVTDIRGKRPVALFLQFEEAYRETLAHLLSAMIAHMMRFLIMNDDRPPVLLLLDEIGTVPPIPGLIGKLNSTRSRKMPIMTYWQSVKQMEAYGIAGNGASQILGACDFQMVFRLNDVESAKWMSERIGMADVVGTSVTSSPERAYATTSQSVSLEPMIWPHQLQSLLPGEVVCAYRETRWRGEATPYWRL